MNTHFVKKLFQLLIMLFFFWSGLYSQIDSGENYFPTKVGTTWVYKIYPQFSNERERQTITKDSVSNLDGSHFIFINGSTRPRYKIDTLQNVYLDPLDPYIEGNLLIFKQSASKFEAWAGSDSSYRVFRIKDVGVDFVIDRPVKYKVVEWGSQPCPQCPQDTFGLSPRSDYYAVEFGLYFVIVEPPSTERILVGFISDGDTLGDVTKVIDLNNSRLSTFVLHQNYPNPFNSSTTILYELNSDQFVSLKIFDVLGREVQDIVQHRQPAGQHKIHFAADGLQTGLYLLQLRIGDFAQTKKLLYLK